jgi:hypothetical protein
VLPAKRRTLIAATVLAASANFVIGAGAIAAADDSTRPRHCPTHPDNYGADQGKKLGQHRDRCNPCHPEHPHNKGADRGRKVGHQCPAETAPPAPAPDPAPAPAPAPTDTVAPAGDPAPATDPAPAPVPAPPAGSGEAGLTIKVDGTIDLTIDLQVDSVNVQETAEQAMERLVGTLKNLTAGMDATANAALQVTGAQELELALTMDATAVAGSETQAQLEETMDEAQQLVTAFLDGLRSSGFSVHISGTASASA